MWQYVLPPPIGHIDIPSAVFEAGDSETGQYSRIEPCIVAPSPVPGGDISTAKVI